MKLITNLKDGGYSKESEHVSQLRLRLLGCSRDTPERQELARTELMRELLHLEQRVQSDRYNKGEGDAPTPKPRRRNAVYGGEHSDYHHRRHIQDASNSEFIAANVVNAYKLEKARRKVDAALEGDHLGDSSPQWEEQADARSMGHLHRQGSPAPPLTASTRDKQHVTAERDPAPGRRVAGKRATPARQPVLRSEVQQEVAVRAASRVQTEQAQTRAELAVAWAGRGLEESGHRAMAQAHYEYSASVLHQLSPTKEAAAETTAPWHAPPAIPPAIAPAVTPVVTPAAIPTTPVQPPDSVAGLLIPKHTGKTGGMNSGRTWRDYLR